MRLFEIEAFSLKQDIETFPFMKKRFVYFSSPLDFQNKSGIAVCQHYTMPENLSEEEIYHYLASVLAALDRNHINRAEYRKRCKHIYDSILNLNSDLASIHNDNKENVDAHVITGALSLFNIDDIKSYVEDEKTFGWYMHQPDWPERYKMLNEIETLTGARITWVMCDKTLNRVYKEVLLKFKK